MSYDPEAAGSLCSRCPLKDARVGGPVPSELNEGAKILVVAEAPGKDECETLRPLTGPSGQECNHALRLAGLERHQVAFANCASCRPKDNKMDRVLAQVRATNKLREVESKKTGKPWVRVPTPAECCRPRLLREMKGYTNVIAMGADALGAILQTDEPKIMENRGGPIVVDLTPSGNSVKYNTLTPPCEPLGQRIKLFPTPHPSFVLRARRWTATYRSDICKAIRWFDGRLGWKDPVVNLHPTPADLREFLLVRRATYWAFDIETEFYDRELLKLGIKRKMINPSLQARIRCLGFHTEGISVVVPLLSVDGSTKFYPSDEESELIEIMRQFFADATRMKVGWNSNYFDAVSIRKNYGFEIPACAHVDLMIVHHCTDPELPHGLGFVGSMLTDVTNWKSDHSGTDAQTDDELLRYNAIDDAVTYVLAPDLIQKAALRQQQEVVKLDLRKQVVCQHLHEIGMGVDQVRRAERELKLREEITYYKKVCQKLVGDAGFNPNSTQQLARVLFNRWGYTPEHFSEKTGAPSTDDDLIRHLFVKKSTKKDHKELLSSVRWYRRKIKYLGTYIGKFKLCTDFIDPEEDWDDEEETEEERDERLLAKGKKRGCVLLDGRIHANWNCHVAVTGRLSSSDPTNLQNIPVVLRDIFIAALGYVFIYADKDQLELRLIASAANATRLLEIFWAAYKRQKAGLKVDKLDPKYDPHSANAALMYGARWFAASDEDKKRIRDSAKIFQYACQYWAEHATIHDIITAGEDKKGNLIYAGMSERETRLLADRWLEANPEIEAWWYSQLEKARRQGYLAEPVIGRRSDFLDGIEEVEQKNKLVNFEIQAAGAAATDKAVLDLVEGPLPFFKWGPTSGLVNYCHDSVLFEVPENKAEEARAQVQEAMNQELPMIQIPLTSEAKILRRWTEDEPEKKVA